MEKRRALIDQADVACTIQGGGQKERYTRQGNAEILFLARCVGASCVFVCFWGEERREGRRQRESVGGGGSRRAPPPGGKNALKCDCCATMITYSSIISVCLRKAFCACLPHGFFWGCSRVSASTTPFGTPFDRATNSEKVRSLSPSVRLCLLVYPVVASCRTSGMT